MRARRSVFFGFAGVLALIGGCASEYVYRPAENATAHITGHSAAHYDIPSQAPQGDVRIGSFGITKIEQANGVQIRAMHVRMIVANNSNQPWNVNTQDVLADFRHSGPVHAAFVRSDVQGLPAIEIPPGDRRTMDLFFPLPPGMENAGKIPEFDVTWKVQAGTTLVAERTPFERLKVEPTYAYAGYGWPGYAWGPYYWYDPYRGPGPGYIGVPGWAW